MAIYEILQEIMDSQNLSVADTARICGLPDSTVRGIIRRKQDTVALEVAFKLSDGLNVSLERLNGLPEKAETPKNKKASSDISEEAQKIAKSYEKLTDHGKGAVKAILGYEEKALAHYSQHEDDGGKIITMPKQKRSGPMVEINVYDQPAAAGLGNYLDEPESHIEQYPRDVIPENTDFGIVISGDSMEPKIHNGGTVFVEAHLSIEPGKIGIFVLNGQAYCKKLMVDRENQQVRLVSLNPKYGDIIVGEFDELRTVGRVLGQWTPGYKQDVFGW